MRFGKAVHISAAMQIQDMFAAVVIFRTESKNVMPIYFSYADPAGCINF